MKLKSKIYRHFEFQQIFLRFLLVDRIMFKKDNLIVMTGKRGSGKSTLALKLLLGFKGDFIKDFEIYYNKEANRMVEKKQHYELKGFKSFDLGNDMAFTRTALQELCKNNKRAFILGDEAITNVARRNSMTRANKMLHEIFTINRKNGNTVLLCLPSIEDFDLSMLQYITHWIHIDDRGLAAVLMPESASIFGRKTWDIDKMKKTYEKFLEGHPQVTTVPYWLFDNFRGYIRFRKLGAKIERDYLKIADIKKNLDTEAEAKETIKKVQAPQINDEKTKVLKEIASKIQDGSMIDTAEYYAYCKELEFNKTKLNKSINEMLATMGDGRNATRAIKENKQKDDASYETQIQAKRIIY